MKQLRLRQGPRRELHARLRAESQAQFLGRQKFGPPTKVIADMMADRGPFGAARSSVSPTGLNALEQ